MDMLYVYFKMLAFYTWQKQHCQLYNVAEHKRHPGQRNSDTLVVYFNGARGRGGGGGD